MEENRKRRSSTIKCKKTNICQRIYYYNGVFVFLSVALFHVSWYPGGRNTGSQVSQSCEYTSKQCVRVYGVTDRRVSFRSFFFIFSQLVQPFFLAIRTAERGGERERAKLFSFRLSIFERLFFNALSAVARHRVNDRRRPTMS